MVKHMKKLINSLLVVLIGIIIIMFFSSHMSISAEEVNQLPKKNFDMVPFYWIIGIVGGCIAVTLSYVSWKKYKEEEKKQTKKDGNN